MKLLHMITCHQWRQTGKYCCVLDCLLQLEICHLGAMPSNKWEILGEDVIVHILSRCSIESREVRWCTSLQQIREFAPININISAVCFPSGWDAIKPAFRIILQPDTRGQSQTIIKIISLRICPHFITTIVSTP